MANTFRMYGPEIGIDTYVVDADVTGVTVNGRIELTPQSGSLSPFTIEPGRLGDLSDEGLVYDIDAIDTSGAAWKALADIQDHMGQASGDTTPFRRAARELFAGAA